MRIVLLFCTVSKHRITEEGEKNVIKPEHTEHSKYDVGSFLYALAALRADESHSG